MKEWQLYHTPLYVPDEQWPDNTEPFSTVNHVTHYESAIRILIDGGVQARGVTEQKLFKDKGLRVTWLSPNTWVNGSIYGGIGFTANFKKIIEGKNAYWAGAVTDYSPVAMRILITDQNYDFLEPYDPAIDNGPWRYEKSTGIHYRNLKYNLEFMVERDVALHDFDNLITFEHHSIHCNLKKTPCPDKWMDKRKIAAKFIAKIISEGLPFVPGQFLKPINNEYVASDVLQLAIGQILGYARDFKTGFSGNISSDDPRAVYHIRATLNFICNEDNEGFKIFLWTFKNFEEFHRSLASLAAKKFGLNSTLSLGIHD